MKNILIYFWTILGFVIFDTVIEMTSYAFIFQVRTPAGFGSKELVILFLLKILFDFIFILMFRLSAGSKLVENGLLYGFMWFLGFSVPQEVGFWLVYKYEVITAYAGLLSGLVTFPVKGWIVKKIKLP